jgi:hypothetical protein
LAGVTVVYLALPRSCRSDVLASVFSHAPWPSSPEQSLVSRKKRWSSLSPEVWSPAIGPRRTRGNPGLLAASGGEMLFKIALALLVAWAAGLLGAYDIGKARDVLLLVGLMVLFLAVLKARDAATRSAGRNPSGDR